MCIDKDVIMVINKEVGRDGSGSEEQYAGEEHAESVE